MIRETRSAISCTGANMEEDILICTPAMSMCESRTGASLSSTDEERLLDKGLCPGVTDTPYT